MPKVYALILALSWEILNSMGSKILLFDDDYRKISFPSSINNSFSEEDKFKSTADTANPETRVVPVHTAESST